MDRLGVLRMWGRKIQGEIWESKEEKKIQGLDIIQLKIKGGMILS